MNNQLINETILIGLVLKLTLLGDVLILDGLVAIILFILLLELIFVYLHCHALSVQRADFTQFEIVVREALLLRFANILISAH